MNILFDTHGNDKQKEVARLWMDPTVSDIVYGGSKGSGKSYLGCSLIFGDAFMYPETQFTIARKNLDDIRKFTIPSIHEVFKHWGIDDRYWKYNGQDNFFTLHNESKIFLSAAKYLPTDPTFQRFGSRQMTRVWLEEAGELMEAAKNNISASAGRWKNAEYNLSVKTLQSCNPSKNYLYKQYYKPHRDGKLEPYKRFVQALPDDNKRLEPGYLEHLRRTLNTAEKERLLKGNWEYDDDPATMIAYDDIQNIFTNEHVPQGRWYITADIARMGKDETIIRVWCGWRVVRRVVLKKVRITETAAKIRELATYYGIAMSQTIADEDGIGGGVVDILRCRGFIANAVPLLTFEKDHQGEKIKANFDNLKSQCAFHLAEMINAGMVFEAAEGDVQEKLTEQLEQLKQKAIDVDMKRGIVSKDKIKEMIGYSPDDMDTYIMRAAFDIQAAPTAAPYTQTF